MAYTFKLVSLVAETSNGGKKVLNLRKENFLDEMTNCLLKVEWLNGPHKHKAMTLLFSHGCRWPQDLLEKADLIEGCHTPVDAFKYKHKMVLLPHPKDPASVLRMDDSFRRFGVFNHNNMYQHPNKPEPIKVKIAPVRPHPNVEVEHWGLRVGLDCPKDGVYKAVQTSPFSIEEDKLVVTENHYSSGLWQAQMIRDKSCNPLEFIETVDEDYKPLSYWQIRYEGNGFMFPETLPYELKYGAMRLEKKILVVTRDIPEAGWAKALAI